MVGKAPLGVTVISILMYIQAIFGVAIGIFAIVDRSNLAENSSAFSESTILWYGIAAIAVGIITGLLAYALRRGSKAVRLIVGFVMLLWIAFGVWALFHPAYRSQGIIQGLIAVIILYYLYGDDDAKVFFA